MGTHPIQTCIFSISRSRLQLYEMLHHIYILCSYLQQNFNKYPMSMGPRDLGYALDDDELDTASK